MCTEAVFMPDISLLSPPIMLQSIVKRGRQIIAMLFVDTGTLRTATCLKPRGHVLW